jgi:SAM-dependent methyltransferase
MENPERFDPRDADGTLIESEHRARYHFAAQAVAGKAVLDAGCGVGYGIEILAGGGAGAVSGVDLDADAVATAKERYGELAEAVVEGDLRELPFDAESFDVVVCLEALEHVDGAGKALAELRRVLRPDGVLVVSSPNPAGYPEGNRHHVHEYGPQELAESLSGHFAKVALYRQDAWLGSTIAPAEGGEDADGRPLRTAPAPDEPTYSVAVGGDASLPTLVPVTAIGLPFELRWWSDQIAAAATEVTEAQERETRALDRLAAVQEELEEALAATEALRQSSADVRAKAAFADEALAREAAARAQLTETSTALLNANQELSQIPVLNHRLAALEELHGEISDRYHEMLNSTSWRITAPLRRR